MGVVQGVPRRREYPQFFRDTIGRNLTYLLEQFPPGEWIVVTPVQMRQVFHTLSYALRLPEFWSRTQELILRLAEPMERAGQRELWASKLDLAIEQSALRGDQAARSDLLYYRGVLHTRQGNVTEGRRLLESAVNALDQSADDPSKRRRLYNRLAFTLRSQSDRSAATAWVSRAQAVEGSRLDEVAYTELVLGVLALDQLDPTSAVDHFAQGLRLAQEAGAPRLIGWLLVNLAIGYRQGGRPHDAIATYERAIEHFTPFEDPLALANARQNLGAVYNDVGEYELAIAQLNACERIYRTLGDPSQLARLTLSLAVVSHNLGRHAEAEVYYEESSHFAARAGVRSTLARAHYGRAQTAAAQGEAQRALGYLRQAEAALRTLEDEPIHPLIESEIAAVRQEIESMIGGGTAES